MTETNERASQTATISISEPVITPPDGPPATAWIVFLLGVALILALFIFLALVAAPPSPAGS